MTVIAVFPPNFSEVKNAPQGCTLIVKLKAEEIKTTLQELSLLIEKSWEGTIAFDWDEEPNLLTKTKAKFRAALYFSTKKCSIRFN